MLPGAMWRRHSSAAPRLSNTGAYVSRRMRMAGSLLPVINGIIVRPLSVTCRCSRSWPILRLHECPHTQPRKVKLSH